MIFTAGDFDDAEMVLALDMDGKLLWKSPNGEAWRGSSPGSRTTPTYNDGAVYHMNPHGRLAAFEAQSGKELWAVDLKAQFDAQYGVWALAENVVVDGDKVLCMPGGPKGRVVALDKRTGKTLWANTEIEHTAAYCSPVVVTHGGVRQLITMTQKSVARRGRGDRQAPLVGPLRPHVAAERPDARLPRRLRVRRLRPLVGRHRAEDRPRRAAPPRPSGIARTSTTATAARSSSTASSSAAAAGRAARTSTASISSPARPASSTRRSARSASPTPTACSTA